MRSLNRIMAVAHKEWRLNLRFPMEYIANNTVGPLKTAVLMYCIYRGLLTGERQTFGMVSRDNVLAFVLVGSTCHSLFMVAMSTFRSRMVAEKYWMTITATLISPASILEVTLGFIIGSIGLNLSFGMLILAGVGLVAKVSISVYLFALAALFLLVIIGFGVGIIGTMMSVVWEGYAFIFDYSMQGLVFLSCFYYPIETIPKFAHPIVRLLPTYQATQLLQQLYLVGFRPHIVSSFSYVFINSVLMLTIPALMFDYSVKKYGVVGY